MDPEQLESIFLFKLSLFLRKFILFALLLNPSVTLEQLLVFFCTSRYQALVYSFLHVFIHKQGRNYFGVSLSRHSLDFVDEALDFDGAVILHLRAVFVQHKNLSQPNATSIEQFNFLSQSLYFCFVHLPPGLKHLPVPTVFTAKSLLRQLHVADLVLFDILC